MSPLAFRLLTAGLVAAFLGVTHAVLPEPEARAERQYQLVIALGYGHLLGSALGPLRAARAAPLGVAFTGASIATAFALYAEGVAAWPGLAFVLLALSVWHFTENDAALARALRSGAALGPLPRGVRAHTAPVLAAGAVVAAALAASPDPGLLGDLFAASTLFHLVGWLVFLVARGVGRARLVGLHAPPLALCALLASAPGSALAPLAEWVFSPALYLFWASLHVAHTAHARLGARL
jgi:hypothetical protein